jgi:hypothetical protein
MNKLCPDDPVVYFDLVRYFQTGDNPPEGGMPAIEMRLGSVSDKELASSGILSGMGHSYHSSLIKNIIVLTRDRITRSTPAISPRITSLDHKTRYHPVKVDSVVKTGIYQLDKI